MMMSSNQTVYLSDVHVYNKTQLDLSKTENRYISRFFFKFPLKIDDSKDKLLLKQEYEKSLQVCTITQDEDGDFDRDSSSIEHQDHGSCPCLASAEQSHRSAEFKIPAMNEVLTLEHRMQTSLDDVGYQIWLGSFLLCDYILDNHEWFNRKVALDLGAGTGLTSIVAALCCENVICTDYCSEILELAKRNWIKNQGLLPVTTEVEKMKFVLLDWTKNDLSSESDSETVNPETSSGDNNLLSSATILLAAEAVYDDDLTDACFSTIYHLLRRPPEKDVLMAVEKRIVFSSASHEVCSPAYEHFRENMNDLSSVDTGNVSFLYQQIPTHDLPQYFNYSRTKELELWKISSSFHSRPNVLGGTT